MENTPNDLDEDIRKELECPICYEYMKPPISMCENGHSICSNCKPKLKNCPSCRKPFLPTRNLALESLSTMFVKENTTPKSSESTAKKYNCPFSTISKEDCAWAGLLQDMKDHIKNCHSNRYDTHKSNGRFNVVLTNLSPERHYRKVVWFGDDLFYVVWEIKGGDFCCAVLYVGPKKKSAKFTYKFSLTTDNGMKNISMIFRTQSVVTSMEKFFTPGDCVLLHFDTVLKFLNSDKFLHCAFEIKPVVSASVHSVHQSKHAASNNINGEPESLTDERDLLEQEVKLELRAYEYLSGGFHPHHSDIFRNGRGGRRGRGGCRGRFYRAARRGAADRHLESQFPYQSGFRDFQNRGKILARGRSLTDLSDPTLYENDDKETFTMGKQKNIAHPNRTKVNSSHSSSALKDEKIDKLLSVSGLGKSSLSTDKPSATRTPQDNLHESVPTAISSPSLSSVKYESSEQVSTQKRTGGNSGTNRAARRGAADRHLESQFHYQSGFRDFQNRGKILTRSRTLPDLRDPTLYDIEDKETFTMGKQKNIAQPNRTKVNSSHISSALKDEKIDKLPSVSGLGKPSLSTDKPSAMRTSQDNLHESVPTAASSPSLSSVKYESSEQVSTQERTGSNSGTNVSQVKLPSSETVTGVNVVDKSTASRDNLTTVPTISQIHGQAEAIYPKLDSLPLDDYQYTNSSPFDNLHDTVQRNASKGKPPTIVSTLIDIFNQRSSNLSPNMSHSHNKTDSKDIWRCSLCGYLAPVKQTDNYYQLVDIQPPGTNWKCKLCEQWRP